jgi:hypothetical protein
VRALAAAAITPLVGWLLLILMLVAVEPWLDTLAAQRLALTLDSQTAISTAALIFVFGAGQAALILGACLMAMGFQLPDSRAERAGRTGNERAPAPQAVPYPQTPLPSRAERLALDLQRDEAQAATRSRAASAASAAASAPQRQISVTLDETRRLGDAYRRPAFAARRAGAAR